MCPFHSVMLRIFKHCKMQNSGIFQNRFFGNGQKNITLMVKYEDNRLVKKTFERRIVWYIKRIKCEKIFIPCVIQYLH